MSQVITDAFSSYWQQSLIEQTPVVLDEFVLAHIPGLDPDAPIDPASGLPLPEQIVHRQLVDQRGRINNDAVAYSIVMDTTVGDFTFNAMYLINTALNLVGMIVHKGEETKLRTDPAVGQTGNSLVKSMLMEYDRAALASQTVIDASTWQIDYAARLRGMDEDLRRQAMGTFGHATFYGDGLKLVNDAGLYKVQPGQGYVGGLLVELATEQEVVPSAKPVGLWLDVYRAGSLLSPWVNHVTLTLSTTDLVDYMDANGYSHFITRLATINSDGSVTDTRAKRIVTLTGDVAGEAVLEGPDNVHIEVEVKDDSHRHTVDTVDGLEDLLGEKQPLDALLTALAALTTSADTLAYFTGVDTAELTALTAFARTLLSDEDAVSARATLDALCKGGDTMEGPLNIDANSNPLTLSCDAGAYALIRGNRGGSTKWFIGLNGSTTDDVAWNSYGGGVRITLRAAGFAECDKLFKAKGFETTAEQGAAENALTRRDFLEEQVATRAPLSHTHAPADVGAAPLLHTHTAAQGNQDVVSSGYGQVGSYVLAWNSDGQSVFIGNTKPGNRLIPATAGERREDGHFLSGTYKCMGHVYGSGGAADATTLWIRTDAASLFEQPFMLSEQTWDNAEHSSLTAIVTFTNAGETIPITLSQDDTEAHGRWLYAMARDGEFGMIAEYVAPTPLAMAASDNPPLRASKMTQAIECTTHWDMMEEAEQAAAWRRYYRELDALTSTSHWPIVEQWPEAPQ